VDLAACHNSPDEAVAKAAAVREAVQRERANLREPNFERIDVRDLAALFDLYDRTFFRGLLAPAAQRNCGRPLALRLSSTMTRSGGKTSLLRRRMSDGAIRAHYEIAVASRMLFMTFTRPDRPVVVCGLACRDRLDALQRIMEHEIIHLAEWVTFGRTRCTGARFKGLAAKIFGHSGTTHELVTPREHAAVTHGVRPGGRVGFEFDGCRWTGLVNRISRRATVLVEDPHGRPYSDGKRYRKFYVPLERLTPVPA
jgi:hypothetical protein